MYSVFLENVSKKFVLNGLTQCWFDIKSFPFQDTVCLHRAMWHVWSRGCCHAVTRDEEIIFTRAPVQRSKSAVCRAGWLGDHSGHWSGLACLNWSWLVAIPINVSTFWKYQRHNWRTLVITRPGRSNGKEMRSRDGWCWWRWWWRCWCWWWCWWRWRCWLLTSSALPTTLAMPLLAMLICLYTLLLSLYIFFLHWIDVISQHHTSQ